MCCSDVRICCKCSLLEWMDMRRYLFVRHLEFHGCYILEKSDYHEQWFNPASGQSASVPREATTNDDIAGIICKQLQIPLPSVLTPRSSHFQARVGLQKTRASAADSPAASPSGHLAARAAPPPDSFPAPALPAAPAPKRGRSRRAPPRR